MNLKSAVETKIFTAKSQKSQRIAEKSLYLGTLQGFFPVIPFHPLGEPMLQPIFEMLIPILCDPLRLLRLCGEVFKSNCRF
jgi:hypothetical protein